jgi:tRNA(adenine34) deaminase
MIDDNEQRGTAAMECSRETSDKALMARCVELSRIAVSKGEYPFGTVITLDGNIVAEAINRTIREGDVTRHAEIIALSNAQKTIGRDLLRRCTLYSNIEPCAMCSYCVRETSISRVVYGLGSPVMGGLSKWNILRDGHMSDRMPQIFGAAPEVASGFLVPEVQQVWRDWNPLAWEMIKLRRLLTDPSIQEGHIHIQPAHRRSLWHTLQILFAWCSQPRIEPEALMSTQDDL